MNRPDLEAIEARANDATHGPWQWEPHGAQLVGEMLGADGEYTSAWVISPLDNGDLGIGADDAEFIAHAREDIPALIAYSRWLEADNGTLQAGHRLNGLSLSKRIQELEDALRPFAEALKVNAIWSDVRPKTTAVITDWCDNAARVLANGSTSPPSTHTSEGSPESTENGGES